MARNGYRAGLAQVNVVVDPELRDRMRRKAQRNGRSMSEEFRLAALAWLGEEVGDADAGVGSRFGVSVAADGSRSGRVPGGSGGVPAGVVAHAVPASLIADSHVPVAADRVPDWDALLERGREAKVLGRVSLYDEPVGDPLVEIA